MNSILNIIILIIHVFCTAFIVLIPFIGNNYFLLLHFIIVPFIVLHWYIDDNTCALTLIEYNIRKYCYKNVDKKDCIMGKIVEPVYDFKKDHQEYSKPIYIATFALWIIGSVTLYNNYKKSKSFVDLITS